MGFRVLVSLHPAIQATGRLTFAPAGLIPAEHTSLRWTHERNHIKRLPVVSGNRLVGIISRANLLHALASLAREASPTAKDDATIRDRVLADLEKQPWNAAGINVVVRNGNLELSGVIFDERQRQALKVATENVPGVKTVHDHLAWVEPMSGMVFDSPEDIAARKVTE